MMDSHDELDPERRALLTSVLAGGAIYAMPVVATLAASDAMAQTAGAASSQSSEPGGGAEGSEPSGSQSGEPTGGQPDVPGQQGRGPDNRPADPGAGGRGRNTGRNPSHGAQSSDDGGMGSQSEEASAGLGPFSASQIGQGFV